MQSTTPLALYVSSALCVQHLPGHLTTLASRAKVGSYSAEHLVCASVYVTQ